MSNHYSSAAAASSSRSERARRRALLREEREKKEETAELPHDPKQIGRDRPSLIRPSDPFSSSPSRFAASAGTGQSVGFRLATGEAGVRGFRFVPRGGADPSRHNMSLTARIGEWFGSFGRPASENAQPEPGFTTPGFTAPASSDTDKYWDVVTPPKQLDPTESTPGSNVLNEGKRMPGNKIIPGKDILQTPRVGRNIPQPFGRIATSAQRNTGGHRKKLESPEWGPHHGDQHFNVERTLGGMDAKDGIKNLQEGKPVMVSMVLGNNQGHTWAVRLQGDELLYYDQIDEAPMWNLFEEGRMDPYRKSLLSNWHDMMTELMELAGVSKVRQDLTYNKGIKSQQEYKTRLHSVDNQGSCHYFASQAVYHILQDEEGK
jgi:hypothetical protein